MEIFKRKYLRVFFIIFIIITVTLFCFVIYKLTKEAERKNPRNWIKVSVVDVINRLPPGLIIELENKGPRIVGRTHFRLVFKINEVNLCRVDTNMGGFKPGTATNIVLQCSDWNSRIYSFSYSPQVSYILQVFPEMGKSIEPIIGRFTLRY